MSSKTEDAFNALAWSYDRICSAPLYLAERERVIDFIAPHLLNGHPEVIDLGCGTGMLLDYLKILPHNYLGLDVSAFMLNRLKQKHPHHYASVRKHDAVEYMMHQSKIGQAAIAPERIKPRVYVALWSADYFEPHFWDYIPNILAPGDKFIVLTVTPSEHKKKSHVLSGITLHHYDGDTIDKIARLKNLYILNQMECSFRTGWINPLNAPLFLVRLLLRLDKWRNSGRGIEPAVRVTILVKEEPLF